MFCAISLSFSRPRKETCRDILDEEKCFPISSSQFKTSETFRIGTSIAVLIAEDPEVSDDQRSNASALRCNTTVIKVKGVTGATPK